MLAGFESVPKAVEVRPRVRGEITVKAAARGNCPAAQSLYHLREVGLHLCLRTCLQLWRSSCAQGFARRRE